MKSALQLLALVLLFSAQATANANEVTLRVMQTADIHMHLLDYDYYADRPNVRYGLARTATLIKQARTEVNNSVLVDNGDLLQGNPLGDFMVRGRHLRFGEVHPAYLLMNQLEYDVGNIGNHEFNYGLDFLMKSLSGASFPYISANVALPDSESDQGEGQPYFQPWIIQNKKVTDVDGESHELGIGYIGFVPPQIMTWDARHLTGRVVANDIVERARYYVPQMKAAGADIVIVVAHSGLNVSTSEGMDENTVYYLADIPDIDAILFGHSHRVFPGDASYNDLPGVDNKTGRIKGVPAVMPGFWGSHLGIIDLTLRSNGQDWQVVDDRVQIRAISKREGSTTIPLVEPDPQAVAAVKAHHDATMAYMGKKVGETSVGINSFFALIKDDPSIQLVNNAQLWYAKRIIHGTEYGHLPLLSAAAPFKAGGLGGADYYTNVPAGDLALKNVADLYIYPNDLKVVQLSGAEVVEWLERSAGQFNLIDPDNPDGQWLINHDFPSYNFDVIDGIRYDIDLTKPARYDNDRNIVSPQHRVINVRYDGKPLDPDQSFLIVTNNYRAGGDGGFPGLGNDRIVIDSPDKNRDVIAAYLQASRSINPSADNNWQFAPWGGAPLWFKSSPKASGLTTDGITPGELLPDGFQKFELQGL